MANAPVIKQLIIIEGSEDIKKTFADLGKSGEELSRKLNGALSGSSTGNLRGYFQTLSTGTSQTREFTRTTNELTDSIRILNPLLFLAGTHVSNLRGFAALARVGIGGLEVAIAGGLLVALQNSSDAIRVLRERLQTIFGEQAGKKAFGDIKEVADKTETSVASVAAAFEQLSLAINKNRRGFVDNPFFVSTSGETAQTPAKQIAELAIQAAKLDHIADPVKAAAEAMSALSASGGLTLEKFQALEKSMPSFAVAFAKAVTGDFSGPEKALERMEQRLAQPMQINETLLKLPQFKKNIDDMAANSVPTLTESFGKLWTNIKKVADASSDFGPTSPLGLGIRGLNALVREYYNLINSGQKQMESGAAGADSNTLLPGLNQDKIVAMSEWWKKWNQGIDEAIPSLGALNQAFDSVEQDTEKTGGMQLFDTIIDKSRSAIQSVTELINKLVELSSNSNLGGFGGGSFPLLPGFAGGGLFRGLSGRDRNLVAVSDYEYFIRPEATKFWGKDFLDWINNMQLPIRGFAAGGLVAPRPALAGGRLPSNNQRPFVLNIPGAGSFRGSIAAPDAVLESLSRASTFEQMTQGGRSPGWRR